MKSKLLLFVIALLFASSAYCQIPEVMVGDTEVVFKFVQPYCSQYIGDSLIDEEFRLINHSNSNFFHEIVLGKPGIDFLHFIPKTIGLQNDSASWESDWVGFAGVHPIPCLEQIYHQFMAIGIDSVVAIKIQDSSFILPIDTQAQKYKSKPEPFFIYSNIADSVLFDSWQLVIDPSAKISFTVDSNSNPLSEYRSKPFTRKEQLNFTFTTALPATDTAQSFPATMKTRVRYNGVDSVYSNTFTIILPAAPKSGVRSNAVQDISFTINPNPFSKLTTFIVTTQNAEAITLEIYDILGNKKVVISNVEIINGSRAFGFDASGLGAGSYFARLVIGEQVLTKRIIIK